MDMNRMAMGGAPSSSRTILEALGYDQDSSFDRPITTQIVSDTNHLSIGGRKVGGGENVQIMIRDDNVVLDLGRSGLAFELVIPSEYTLDNALALFQPIEWILGNTQCGYANMQYYLQQRLARQDPKKYRKQRQAMLLSYHEAQDGMGSTGVSFGWGADQSGYELALPAKDNTPVTNAILLPFLEAIKGQFQGASSAANVLSNPIRSYVGSRQRFTNALRAGTVATIEADEYGVDFNGAFKVFKVYIPLNELFPQLKEFPDDLIYIGLG